MALPPQKQFPPQPKKAPEGEEEESASESESSSNASPSKMKGAKANPLRKWAAQMAGGEVEEGGDYDY